MKSKILEISTVCQGEGKYIGVPHLLVRLTGCNLNCSFKDSICDTSYASWNPEQGIYELSDIEKAIQENPQINYCFITGGEPTIHKELLQQILTLLKQYNYFTAIETNGTNFVEVEGLDFISMSPKLKNSVPVLGQHIKIDTVDKTITDDMVNKHEKNRVNYDSMKQWCNKYKNNVQLKFVISDLNGTETEEFKYIQTICNIPNNQVYLMPEGMFEEQLKSKRQWLLNYCVKEGYNYTDRLHILIFGHKRGV